MIIHTTYILFVIGLLILIAAVISIRASRVRIFMCENFTHYRVKIDSVPPYRFITEAILISNNEDFDTIYNNHVIARLNDFILNSPSFLEILFSRKRLKKENFYTRTQINTYF